MSCRLKKCFKIRKSKQNNNILCTKGSIVNFVLFCTNLHGCAVSKWIFVNCFNILTPLLNKRNRNLTFLFNVIIFRGKKLEIFLVSLFWVILFLDCSLFSIYLYDGRALLGEFGLLASPHLNNLNHVKNVSFKSFF